MRQDLVTVLDLDAEVSRGQDLDDPSLKLDVFFATHVLRRGDPNRSPVQGQRLGLIRSGDVARRCFSACGRRAASPSPWRRAPWREPSRPVSEACWQAGGRMTSRRALARPWPPTPTSAPT